MAINIDSTRPDSADALDGKSSHNRTVHHWALCWLGRPATDGSHRYTWKPEPGEIEVSIQQYGDPRWIESLYTDMIETAREILEDNDPEYTSVRLRVNLYTHQPDGRDAKFTLEHIERR